MYNEPGHPLLYSQSNTAEVDLASLRRSRGHLYVCASNVKCGIYTVLHFEVVMDSPRAAPTAAETGVDDRVGAGPRLCAMCALTRCPAASAEHKLSSPARTAAPTMRASIRALSPGLVGCDPRTPRRSSIAD